MPNTITKQEIKKVTIEAVSIKKANAAGIPYTWKDKKRNNAVTPRTRVSIKVGKTDDDWLMGWSYKDGSAAESIKNGDVIEILYVEERGDDGKIWKNWKFPKPEDVTAAENAALKAKIAAMEAQQGSGISNVPYVVSTPTAPENPSAVEEPPF